MSLRSYVKRLARPLAAPLLRRLESAADSAVERRMRGGAGFDDNLLSSVVRSSARMEARVRKLEGAIRTESTPVGPSAEVIERDTFTIDDILYPDLSLHNWQMQNSERMALTGLLYRLRPKAALEVGVYWGGSLGLISQFAEKTIAIDIDPAVADRVEFSSSTEFMVGSSATLIPEAISRIAALDMPLNFVLIDADHSEEGVRRDIELVLSYRPQGPMVIVMHDSGNPGCRKGMKSANWANSPFVHYVDLDFVPGSLIRDGESGAGEVWGGLGIALLLEHERTGSLVVGESAGKTIETLHKAADR